VTYPDHHIYDENDLLSLAEIANKTQSILVSTQKDFVRIPKSYRSLVNTLEGKISFEKEEIIKEILTNIIENYIENEK
jgi:tetraacyldisaccharide 4'-kinase